MRSPDPACNPYLALAVLIGAAADGIAQRTLPGPPLVGSTYDLSDNERRERGIGTLPKSLRQAIAELDGDAVVRAALGDHLYHAFRDAKLEEYERYRRAVHPWEREQYLGCIKRGATCCAALRFCEHAPRRARRRRASVRRLPIASRMA